MVFTWGRFFRSKLAETRPNGQRSFTTFGITRGPTDFLSCHLVWQKSLQIPFSPRGLKENAEEKFWVRGKQPSHFSPLGFWRSPCTLGDRGSVHGHLHFLLFGFAPFPALSHCGFFCLMPRWLSPLPTRSLQVFSLIKLPGCWFLQRSSGGRHSLYKGTCYS